MERTEIPGHVASGAGGEYLISVCIRATIIVVLRPSAERDQR